MSSAVATVDGARRGNDCDGGGETSAAKRPQIASAALTEICCPTIARAGDPNKVLRVAFAIEETGFDPVKVTDEYSNRVIEQTNEPLLTYDYLARPAKLAPLTAESLPEVTDNGKTYVFHIRKGIVF